MRIPQPDIPKPYYRWAWRLWMAWFAVWEGMALMDKGRGDTYTANSRPIIQANSLTKAASAIGLAWLVYHYLLDGKNGLLRS